MQSSIAHRSYNIYFIGAVKINGEVDREYRSVYHLKVRAGEIDCGLKPDNNSNVGKRRV